MDVAPRLGDAVICPQCGQEIDDGALVCYRCGAATGEREREPADLDERRDPRRWSPILLAIILVCSVLFFAGLALTGRPVAPIVWAMLAVAAGLLAWRLRIR